MAFCEGFELPAGESHPILHDGDGGQIALALKLLSLQPGRFQQVAGDVLSEAWTSPRGTFPTLKMDEG